MSNESSVIITFRKEPDCDLEKTREALRSIFPSAVPNFVSNRIFVPNGNCKPLEVRDAIAKLPGVYSVALAIG